MKKGFGIVFLVFLFCNIILSQTLKIQNDSVTQEKNTSDLVTQLDSLNFAFGLSYGDSIRNYYFKNDTTDYPMIAFMDALDTAFAQETNQDEMYKKGIKVEDFIKRKNSKGLMADSTITFNQNMVEIGLIDALKGSYSLMKPQEAILFLQRKMNKQKYGSVTEKDEIVIRILNYAYGMSLGASIKDDYFKGDSTNLKVKSFIAGLKCGTKEVENEYPQLVDLGTKFGISLKEQAKFGYLNDTTLKVNSELIRHGLINGLMGLVGWMTPYEAQKYIKTTMQVLHDKKIEIEFSQNKATGEKFLTENAKKPGIITTASGLQYEVIAKGNGSLPSDSSKVKVNYHGTLVDSTLFDNSKEPIVFSVNQVLKGWTEALKLMPVGSKFKIYVPQELAYGSKTKGTIKPLSMLIFEIELLSIEE